MYCLGILLEILRTLPSQLRRIIQNRGRDLNSSSPECQKQYLMIDTEVKILQKQT